MTNDDRLGDYPIGPGGLWAAPLPTLSRRPCWKTRKGTWAKLLPGRYRDAKLVLFLCACGSPARDGSIDRLTGQEESHRT
jgi:hypothetical protein